MELKMRIQQKTVCLMFAFKEKEMVLDRASSQLLHTHKGTWLTLLEQPVIMRVSTLVGNALDFCSVVHD